MAGQIDHPIPTGSQKLRFIKIIPRSKWEAGDETVAEGMQKLARLTGSSYSYVLNDWPKIGPNLVS